MNKNQELKDIQIHLRDFLSIKSCLEGIRLKPYKKVNPKLLKKLDGIHIDFYGTSPLSDAPGLDSIICAKVEYLIYIKTLFHKLTTYDLSKERLAKLSDEVAREKLILSEEIDRLYSRLTELLQ